MVTEMVFSQDHRDKLALVDDIFVQSSSSLQSHQQQHNFSTIADDVVQHCNSSFIFTTFRLLAIAIATIGIAKLYHFIWTIYK